MLDYTKTAIEKIIKDCKRFGFICNVVIQAFSVTYLVYALITQTGNVWVNAALLSLTAAYFVFFLCVSRRGENKETAQTQKIGKRIFKHGKQLVKLLNLAIIIYGVYNTADNVNLLALVQISFMLVGWVLGIVFDVVIFIIERYKNLILEGIKADLEPLTKPVKAVGNFFKGLKGEEIAPEQEPTKTRLWLNTQVTDKKEQKKAEKLAKKQAKKTKKLPSQKNAEEETAIALSDNKKKSFWGRKK